MRTVLVGGTWSFNNDPARDTKEWYWPGSPFVAFLEKCGVSVVMAPGPAPFFVWSSGIDGLGPSRGHLTTWAGAGAALFAQCVPTLCPDRRIPGDELCVIEHSHGRQPVLFAAANGLKIHTLISVCSPIRKDLDDVAHRARPNIKNWIHVYSDHTDQTQIAGELGDGRIGVIRKESFADINIEVPGVGHSGLLNTPEMFHHWTDHHIFDHLTGAA